MPSQTDFDAKPCGKMCLTPPKEFKESSVMIDCLMFINVTRGGKDKWIMIWL